MPVAMTAVISLIACEPTCEQAHDQPRRSEMRKFVLAGAVTGSAVAMWAGSAAAAPPPTASCQGVSGVGRGALRPWNGRLPHPPASGRGRRPRTFRWGASISPTHKRRATADSEPTRPSRRFVHAAGRLSPPNTRAHHSRDRGRSRSRSARVPSGVELSRGCSVGALGRRSEDHLHPHGRDPKARPARSVPHTWRSCRDRPRPRERAPFA